MYYLLGCNIDWFDRFNRESGLYDYMHMVQINHDDEEIVEMNELIVISDCAVNWQFEWDRSAQ